MNFPDERFGGTILLYLIVGTLAAIPYSHGTDAERPERPASHDDVVSSGRDGIDRRGGERRDVSAAPDQLGLGQFPDGPDGEDGPRRHVEPQDGVGEGPGQDEETQPRGVTIGKSALSPWGRMVPPWGRMVPLEGGAVGRVPRRAWPWCEALDDAKDANRDIGAVVRVAHGTRPGFLRGPPRREGRAPMVTRHCSAFLVEHDQNSTDELISPSISRGFPPDLDRVILGVP